MHGCWQVPNRSSSFLTWENQTSPSEEPRASVTGNGAGAWRGCLPSSLQRALSCSKAWRFTVLMGNLCPFWAKTIHMLYKIHYDKIPILLHVLEDKHAHFSCQSGLHSPQHRSNHWWSDTLVCFSSKGKSWWKCRAQKSRIYNQSYTDEGQASITTSQTEIPPSSPQQHMWKYLITLWCKGHFCITLWIFRPFRPANLRTKVCRRNHWFLKCSFPSVHWYFKS